MNTTTLYYLAATGDNFWGSPIGGVLKSIMVAFGILVVIIAGFRVTKDIMGGKAGNAVKTIALAAILAAVMFRPEIITGLINWMGDLIQTLLNSTGSITKQTGA